MPSSRLLQGEVWCKNCLSVQSLEQGSRAQMPQEKAWKDREAANPAPPSQRHSMYGMCWGHSRTEGSGLGVRASSRPQRGDFTGQGKGCVRKRVTLRWEEPVLTGKHPKPLTPSSQREEAKEIKLW